MKNKDKMRELIAYLIFGVLTTAVGMGTYFVILWLGEHVWHISPETSIFNVVRVIAQILHWVFAVLFAFFTNKKWVFNDNVHDTKGVFKQLTVFAGGRVVTLGLDYLLNWLMLLAMNALALSFLDGLFGISLGTYNELVAWFVTQVAVVVSNYFISKLFVFKNKTGNDKKGASDDNFADKSE